MSEKDEPIKKYFEWKKSDLDFGGLCNFFDLSIRATECSSLSEQLPRG